jgi:hypothetical protein
LRCLKIGDHVEIDEAIDSEVAGWFGIITEQGKINKDEYLVDFQIGEEFEVNPPRLFINKKYLKKIIIKLE